MNTLLVDAGNTCVKWALSDGGVLHGHGEARHRGRPLSTALEALTSLSPRPARALVGNVAGASMRECLASLAGAAFGVTPEFAAVRKEAGSLRVAYEDTARLGVDRWLAMLGARRLHEMAFVVADLGTAVTVDAADAQGAHQGGLIAPGRHLMRAALLTRTADIAEPGTPTNPRAVAGGRWETSPPGDMFATDTEAAVASGTDHAIAALVERACDEFERRIDAEARLLLTGGDAPAIAPLIRRPLAIHADLVLQGLVVYAEIGR